MSTLLLNELWTGIVFSQPFKIENDLNVAHLRPWIYKQGTLQDGDFRARVYDGAVLLATSTIPYTDINKAITEDYAHGFVRFDFDSLSLKIPVGDTEKEYTVKFDMINYTNNASNFIGAVRRWDLKTYPTYGDGVIDNQAPNDWVEPIGLELYKHNLI